MHTQTHTLPRLSTLPAFGPRPLSPSRAQRIRPATDQDRPAVLWRDSLTVMDEPFARLEAWAFAMLTLMVLPVTALHQFNLWQLLNSGSLDRAVRAFLLPLG